MKRNNLVDGLLFVALVLVGAQARVALEGLPNFAPVAAMALFAGYFFRSWLLALCLPLCVMILSDMQIGGYDWRMMLVVYGMLAAPVAARPLLRRYLPTQRNSVSQSVAGVSGLIGCSLLSSVLFFVVTNFGSWIWFNLYEHSWSGLLHCYYQALPFFRYTLAGDLCFAVVLFGGYATLTQLGLARQTQTPLSVANHGPLV